MTTNLIDEKALDKALEECSGETFHNRRDFQGLIEAYEAAKEADQPVELSPVEEIKPCPYVNGFSSDNSGVDFMLKRYPNYSDFILFEGGRPSRCFRFDGFAIPKREIVEVSPPNDFPKGAAVKVIRKLVPDDGKEGSFYRDGHAWVRNRDGTEYRNIDLAPNCHRKWLMEKALCDELIAGLCFHEIEGDN